MLNLPAVIAEIQTQVAHILYIHITGLLFLFVCYNSFNLFGGYRCKVIVVYSYIILCRIYILKPDTSIPVLFFLV